MKSRILVCVCGADGKKPRYYRVFTGTISMQPRRARFEIASQGTTSPVEMSPLLALPPELRIQIYEELLCPNPEKVLTLYHDRRGPGGPFNLHPVILRANKQICLEASSVLYSHNIFEVNLTSDIMYKSYYWNYSDCRVDPRSFFRTDHIDTSPRHVPGKGGLRPLLRGVI